MPRASMASEEESPGGPVDGEVPEVAKRAKDDAHPEGFDVLSAPAACDILVRNKLWTRRVHIV